MVKKPQHRIKQALRGSNTHLSACVVSDKHMCEEVNVSVYFAPLLMELKATWTWPEKKKNTFTLFKPGLIHESVTSLKTTSEGHFGREESPDWAYHPHFPHRTPNTTFFTLSICVSARCQPSHSSVTDLEPGLLTHWRQPHDVPWNETMLQHGAMLLITAARMRKKKEINEKNKKAK